MTSNLIDCVRKELATCGGCGKDLYCNKGTRTCDKCGKPLPQPSNELRMEILMSARCAINIDPKKPYSEFYMFGYRVFPKMP